MEEQKQSTSSVPQKMQATKKSKKMEDRVMKKRANL
jgi:hypothetical protein